MATIEAAAGLSRALVVSVGAGWVTQGALTLADLFVFLVYMVMLYRPLIDLSHANEGLQSAMAAAERVFAVLDEQPTVADRPGRRAPEPRRTLVDELRHVKFAYEPGRPVLLDVSMRVEPGQVVALVGRSGRRQEHDRGAAAALVRRPAVARSASAGHDLRDLPLVWLRQQVSAVLQDVFLFHGSVRDNLLMAGPRRPRTSSRRRRGRPTPTTSSGAAGGLRDRSASAACASRAARSSASRSPGRC